MECVHAVIELSHEVWPPIADALSVRLGIEKTNNLWREGIVWRILQGGVRGESMQELEEETKDHQMSSHFALIHEWTCSYKDADCQRSTLETFGEKLDAELFLYIYELGFRINGKTFFTTDTGYVGRADHPIQKDDLLCVLQGCDSPAVLRSCNDGIHRLITFSYTHDIFEDSDTALDIKGCKGEN